MPDQDLLATCWTTAGDAAPLRGDEPRRHRSDAVRRKLLEAAGALGARHVKVAPDVSGEPWDHDRWVAEFAELAAVPLRHIVGVELSDADADQVGTLFEDTANRRRLCGEGSFDLQGCIGALRAAGWTGPWGVEILSEDFRRLPVRWAAAAAFATAEAQLGLADDGR